jgi:hypothetical protein
MTSIKEEVNIAAFPVGMYFFKSLGNKAPQIVVKH